jgi:FHA domain
MASVVFYLDDASTQVVPLDDAEVITIGRHPDSVVSLTNASVSGHHATIKRRDKGFFVQDLGSSNGTRLNGADIEEALLNDGDRITFGDVQALFYAGDPPAVQVVPEPRVVVVPPPDVAQVAHAAPRAGAPRQQSRFGRRFVPRRAPSGYPDESGGGCATALFLTILFAIAFFIGLALRHMKETDRNLLGDIFNRITKSMPKVKIEQE